MGCIGDSVDSIKSIQTRRLLTQCVSSGGYIVFYREKNPIHAREISLFNVELKFQLSIASLKSVEIPIVHRVIKVHERQDTGAVDVLTKGDNNKEDDELLYAQGQQWLHRHHIVGRAVGFLPNAGWFTVVTTEHPIIKWILCGALGLLAITSKD